MVTAFRKDRVASGNHWYKDGYWAGYSDYRHGRGNAKPVTLAKTAEKPIYPVGKRNHLIGLLVEEVSDWRSTPFEKEGPLIQGIRSRLCLDGHEWKRADAEALFLVRNALKKIGVPRPSWGEGQPGYLNSPDRCAWCAGPVDDIGNGKASRYCSVVCAKSALAAREFKEQGVYDKAHAAAERVLHRSRTTVRKCEECGDPFQPIREKSKQRFCSFSCGSRHRMKTHPPSMLHATAVTMSCVYCGGDFQARAKSAITCSKVCGSAYTKIKKGQTMQLLKPHVFDRYITTFVNAHGRMTPQVFDVMTTMAA